MTNALILLGHGSHISPNTAGVVWDAVDKLRALGVADEITAAFWKEYPTFHGVYDTVTATDITLVPLFTAQGYFTQTVIPAEMNLSGIISTRERRTIRYAPPPVFHPRITQIVRQRVDDALRIHGLSPEKATIAIIGHSTRKNPKSREATEYQADLLRQMGIYGDVLTAFLDDEPAISTIYGRTPLENIIAVPLFLAMGSHTTIDVPNALGLPKDATYASIHGKKLIYTPAIGADNDLTDLIIDLAHEAGATLYASHSQKSVWDNFPRGGWDRLQAYLAEHGTLQIGELMVKQNGVRVASDENITRVITTPSDLRRFIRDEPFRPLATAKNLRGGWIVPAMSLDEVCAIVETVYPSLLPHIMPTAPYMTTPLADTLARQTGIYRDVAGLDDAQIADVVKNVCGGCIRNPTWYNRELAPIACDEACNWWLSNALSKND